MLAQIMQLETAMQHFLPEVNSICVLEGCCLFYIRKLFFVQPRGNQPADLFCQTVFECFPLSDYIYFAFFNSSDEQEITSIRNVEDGELILQLGWRKTSAKCGRHSVFRLTLQHLCFKLKNFAPFWQGFDFFQIKEFCEQVHWGKFEVLWGILCLKNKCKGKKTLLLSGILGFNAAPLWSRPS